MKTRCPSWCDRLLLSHSAKNIIVHVSTEGLLCTTINGCILPAFVHYLHPIWLQKYWERNLVLVYTPHQLLTRLYGGQMFKILQET